MATRREFLTTALVGVSSPVAVGQGKGTTGPSAPAEIRALQRYGSDKERTAFAEYWEDLPSGRFRHQEHGSFHRLWTRLDVLYCRCQQPLPRLEPAPLRIVIRLRCPGVAGQTLFTLGVHSRSHGSWTFSLGASPSRSRTGTPQGWSLVVNAANPSKERRPMAGFDNRDWHSFVLEIPGVARPAQLYCDGQQVLELVQPVTPRQRALISEQEKPRHGSVQQLVPETPGAGDYVFVESRHPGQVLEIDSFYYSQEQPSTPRLSLPVLLDLDWKLAGTRMTENPFARDQSQPILRKTDLPPPAGTSTGAFHVQVIQAEGGFVMYLCGRNQLSVESGMNSFSLYRAVSADGIDWNLEPPMPVFAPGAPEGWDGGSLGKAVVLKEGNLYRMWYGGYVSRLRQGRAGYAESRDGIHWRRPALGFHSFAGKDTNICFPLQAGLNYNEYQLPVEVVRDDEAPSERRYVMFLHSQGPQGFVVNVAVSPDGRSFSAAPHNARHYAFYREPRDSTLHGAPVVLRDGRYWWAWVGHIESEKRGYRTRCTGWVVSPDSEHLSLGLWRSSRPHLAPDPGRWERSRIDVGSVVEVGDTWRIYYSSEGSVGLATIGRHRLYGLEILPGRKSGELISVALEPADGSWKKSRLEINASGLGSHDFLEAELWEGGRSLPGFTFQESLPVVQSSSRTPLRWKRAGGNLPDRAGPLQVRVRLTRKNGNPQLHGIYVSRAS